MQHGESATECAVVRLVLERERELTPGSTALGGACSAHPSGSELSKPQPNRARRLRSEAGILAEGVGDA